MDIVPVNISFINLLIIFRSFLTRLQVCVGYSLDEQVESYCSGDYPWIFASSEATGETVFNSMDISNNKTILAFSGTTQDENLCPSISRMQTFTPYQQNDNIPAPFVLALNIDSKTPEILWMRYFNTKRVINTDVYTNNVRVLVRFDFDLEDTSSYESFYILLLDMTDGSVENGRNWTIQGPSFKLYSINNMVYEQSDKKQNIHMSGIYNKQQNTHLFITMFSELESNNSLESSTKYQLTSDQVDLSSYPSQMLMYSKRIFGVAYLKTTYIDKRIIYVYDRDNLQNLRLYQLPYSIFPSYSEKVKLLNFYVSL
eukprot:403333523